MAGIKRKATVLKGLAVTLGIASLIIALVETFLFPSGGHGPTEIGSIQIAALNMSIFALVLAILSRES